PCPTTPPFVGSTVRRSVQPSYQATAALFSSISPAGTPPSRYIPSAGLGSRASRTASVGFTLEESSRSDASALRPTRVARMPPRLGAPLRARQHRNASGSPQSDSFREYRLVSLQLPTLPRS